MNQQTLYPNLILEALRNVRYPGNGENIVDLGMVEDDIRIDGRKIEFSLKFAKATDPFIKSVVKSAETAILTYIGADIEIKGNIRVKTPQITPQRPVSILPGVKNIIGVSSGKGGVGKSTVAANLAISLKRLGFKVGLLDADIFGPSVPKMFGVEDEQLYMHQVDGRDLIIPIEQFGIKLLSIGFMVDKNKPVLWRGSMASNALNQLITQADWGELDYFVIDMPPGTSDIHLTLVQTLGLTGVVIVSTPQEVALADARKGIAMFMDPKVNVPVLGLIENMAWFTPLRHPDERYYLFGHDGVKNLAHELKVELLGQIPLVEDICEHADSGKPIALANSMEGNAFLKLAEKVNNAVNLRNQTLPPTNKVEVN